MSALWQPADPLDVYYSYDSSADNSASGYPHMFRETPNTRPFASIFGLDDSRVETARIGAPLGPSVIVPPQVV